MTKQLGKIALYKQRCNDKSHHIQMHVSNDFLKRTHPTQTDPYTTLKSICRDFNAYADGWTKTNEYSVPLNIPLINMAADFHYQYKRLRKWAEYEEYTTEFNDDIDPAIHQLFEAVTLRAPRSMIAMEKDKLLSVLPQINQGSAAAVLLYMKVRCSRHNAPGGETGLMVKTIADDLQINRATVTRAMNKLMELGLVEVIYKNRVKGEGKSSFTTVSKYKINI